MRGNISGLNVSGCWKLMFEFISSSYAFLVSPFAFRGEEEEDFFSEWNYIMPSQQKAREQRNHIDELKMG